MVKKLIISIKSLYMNILHHKTTIRLLLTIIYILLFMGSLALSKELFYPYSTWNPPGWLLFFLPIIIISFCIQIPLLIILALFSGIINISTLPFASFIYFIIFLFYSYVISLATLKIFYLIKARRRKAKDI